MILVLTYHKVLRGLEENSEFYSTTVENFERHLEILSSSQLAPLTATALAEAPRPGKSSFYLLTFDDGTCDHEELVLPLLNRYRQSAVFFVPTSKVNRDGYLSDEGVKALSHSGHCIGSHSHDHQRMDTLSDEDVRVQIEMSCAAIERLTGKRPDTFAPPGGYIDARVRRAALEGGMRVIRTMQWGYNSKPDFTNLCCVPVNRYMTEQEFRKVLQFRSQAVTYTVKQTLKRLLPMSVYASLRDALLGWLRSK
jgi:peptidoglycan/xylan/chitin deacetylase (PgdA/CDA1 family)